MYIEITTNNKRATKIYNHSYIQSLINSKQVLTPLFCCNDMSWSTTAPTCFTHVGLRWMTVTLILWLVSLVQFVYWHLTGRAVEMQQESQGKRHSARKRVAGNYSLVCGGDRGVRVSHFCTTFSCLPYFCAPLPPDSHPSLCWSLSSFLH